MIYLDYNASTPVAPEVAAAMRPLLETAWGNPSNPHWAAQPAQAALSHARGQVARLIGAAPSEIVFTSGGTEASNLAIKGVFFARRERGDHIVTTAIEHPATLEPCRFLQRLGADVTVLPVDRAGRVDPDAVRQAIGPRTLLVSLMHANNEVGTIQPVAEIARIARDRDVLVHVDAAQSLGKIPVDVGTLGVDLLSIAGHKLYAPKGIGALYVRDGIRLEPAQHGAGHEGGRRAGTESALLAAGLGAACALAADALAPSAVAAIAARCGRLWRRLTDALGDALVLNGHATERLPNTLNVSFVGHVGSELLARVPAIAASTGSACHAGAVTISPVLAAMGVPAATAAGAVRLSLGRDTTDAEIDAAADLLVAAAAETSGTPLRVAI